MEALPFDDGFGIRLCYLSNKSHFDNYSWDPSDSRPLGSLQACKCPAQKYDLKKVFEAVGGGQYSGVLVGTDPSPRSRREEWSTHFLASWWGWRKEAAFLFFFANKESRERHRLYWVPIVFLDWCWIFLFSLLIFIKNRRYWLLFPLVEIKKLNSRKFNQVVQPYNFLQQKPTLSQESCWNRNKQDCGSFVMLIWKRKRETDFKH